MYIYKKFILVDFKIKKYSKLIKKNILQRFKKRGIIFTIIKNNFEAGENNEKGNSS